MFDGKQPERKDGEGGVAVRLGRSDDEVVIECTQDDNMSTVVMSRYNAWRAFAMLSIMLGMRLPSKIGKGIKL